MSLGFEHTDRILDEARLFNPPESFTRQSHIASYIKEKGFQTWDELYAWSIAHVETFWAEQAKELTWFSPWTKVREWTPPYAQWFQGATCNIVYNALDRHMQTDVKNKVAFYWESENGESRAISYQQLFQEDRKSVV